MKNISILIALFVIAICCENRSSDNFPKEGAASVTIPQNMENIPLTEFAEDIRYVGLEFTENSMLGSVDKIRVFEGRLYVLDRSIAKKLLVFTTDGKYIKQIGRQGRQKNEYVKISDFEIDYVNREVIVDDRDGRRMLIYDLDGLFKREIIPEVLVDAMALLENGEIMVGNAANSFQRSGDKENGDYKMFILDNDGKIKKRFMKDDFRSELPIGVSEYLVSNHEGKVTFAPQFHNVIYEVAPDAIKPLYHIEFEDTRAITMDEIAQMPASTKELYDGENSGRLFFTGTHGISDDWLYLLLGFRKNTHAFFDRNSNKLILSRDVFCGDKVTTDENGGFWGYVQYLSILLLRGEPVTVRTMEELDALLEADTDTAREAKKIKMASEVENSNPVLVNFKLKNNI